MSDRAFDLPAEVQSTLAYVGADGARWLEQLPRVVRNLEHEWDISVGAALNGGSEALVARATTADGSRAIIKIGVPGPTGFEQEARALQLADGRGYVKLLRYDAARRVMLQEELGTALAQLGLSIRHQIEAICATMRQAWIAVPDDLPLMNGSEKARSLAKLIATAWQQLERPCSERAVECALAFADARHRAYDAATSVLVHGDAHSQNTLLKLGADPADFSAYRFVDPDGMRAEPALDLAIPMRSWSEELLEGDALTLAHARCEFIGRLTGVATEPIWQWGFMERMSTGLYLMQLGWRDEGRGMLKVADALAA